MNHKQMFRRLNEAYENLYGRADEDEWFANPNDAQNVWKFRRPSLKLTVQMKLDVKGKCVETIECVDGTHKYERGKVYSW